MGRSDFYGWKLLAAAWVIIFITFPFTINGSSLMNAEMATQLHWSRTEVGVLPAGFAVVSGLMSLLTAILVRRIGVRRTVVMGSGMIIIGTLAMATVVDSLIGAVLAYSVLVGIGVSMAGPFGVQLVVIEWFVRRRSLALSIFYTASGVGGFVAAPLLSWIIASSRESWRAGWWLVAGLVVVAGLVGALFIRERPADLGQEPDGSPVSDADPAGTSAAAVPGRPSFITKEEWTFAEVVRSVGFWIMVLSLCGGSAGLMLFMAQGVLHLQDLGHSKAEVAMTLSVFAGASLFSRLVVGALGDRIDPRKISAACVAVFGIGLLLVVHARSPALMYAFAVCLGFGFSAAVLCINNAVVNYYGLAAFPTAVAVMTVCNTVISFLVPLVGGYVYDKTGSYAPVFYVLAAWSFAGTAALALMNRPIRPAAPNPLAVGVATAGTRSMP